MAPNPADRPSAEKVLQSPLLSRRAGSPRAQQPAHQPSTASTQSAATSVEAAPAAPPAPVAAGTKQFGGLVLSRSVAQ